MKQIKYYKWTIVTVILIWIAILMPGGNGPSIGIPHIDKVVHFGMFATLVLSFYSEYTYQHKKLPKHLVSWGIIEGFALLTEIAQLFVPGRSYDIKDFIADSLGMLLMMIIFSKIWITRKKE